MKISVQLESLAKISGLLDEVDRLNLLLQEKYKELLLFIGTLQKLVECRRVLLASHECWRHLLAENFGELAVSGLHNLVDERVILVEVGSDQFKLLLALEESLDLMLQFAKWLSCLGVGDLSPQLLLQGRVGETVLADLADTAGLVASIAFERLELERLFFIVREVW